MIDTELDGRLVAPAHRGGTVVVVGVDGSEASGAALRWAAREATARRSALEVVLAWDATGPDVPWALDQAVPFDAGAADRSLARQVRDLLGDPVPHHVHLHAFDDAAAPALVDAAGHDHLLVVGSRGHGRPNAFRLGSVAELVVRHARTDVVVVPEDVDQRGGRVVAGVDGSPASIAALRWAAAEARRWSATLEVVHAAPGPIGEGGAGYADAAVAAALDRVSDEAEVEPSLLVGRPADVLVARARGATLLVVGRRGAGGFDELELGSVALECARRSGAPVAIIRQRG